MAPPPGCQTVVCLFCLSVTLVYCGQTVGWIKIKLGMHVGLGPGHIVLDGDAAAPPSKKGAEPSPIFGPSLLWMIKMAPDMEVGLGPGHIVLDRDSATRTKGGTAPIIGLCLLWQNRWMD